MTIKSNGMIRSPAAASTISRRAAERRKVALEQVKTQGQTRVLDDAFEVTTGPVSLGHIAGEAGVQGDGLRATELVNGTSDVVAMAERRNQMLEAAFEALREQTRGLVTGLAQAGFSPEAVQSSREELRGIRGQMQGLRHKQVTSRRQIKVLRSAANQTPALDPAQLRRRTEQSARLRPAWRRAADLPSLAPLYQSPLVSGQGIVRTPLGGGAAIDRHALGSYVSALAPTRSASKQLCGLVTGNHDSQPRLPTEMRQLHDDARRGRLGREFEALSKISS